VARAVTETDRAIIRQLQQHARMSYAELSRTTGIPESTVRRRMDRLQQRGIIEFAMVADPSRLGYDLRSMIGLRVELSKLQSIAEELRNMAEVTFAGFVTGNFDIVVQVVVQSQEELVEFLTQRLSSIDGVRSTETFVMPFIIKPMTSWMLPEGDPNALAAELSGAAPSDLSGEDGVDRTGTPRPVVKRGRPRRVPA
jgi:Lrp/AsnC family transcriptional regulator for asnA, asnC and gidA